MRNYLRKQLLEIMKPLFAADKLLKKIIMANNVQNELLLLQDMQAAAIEMGNAIEKSQGEGSEIVSMLEEFCELLWKISQSSFYEKIELSKVSHKQLTAIRRQIEDSPVEFEIVFLPYKVSMWDSLESIWMAAKEDDSCTAYVIPIPYFDKEEDESLGEGHYEGGQFPEYVPIVDWQQYDFENRHPDIIYIHNPYDERNNVTSVHPSFYSNVLKGYTDKLVYIPYYVCSESTREDNCLQNGIVNADVVIVQSDKIKDEYIKYYRKGMEEDAPKNKFLALGSPKFDKVIHSDKIQNELTIQWKQRAGGRKIILYNTHLTTFLQYEEKAVEKIATVFQHFAGRDDVLLLWRPHPLCKTTLKAMRPELYEAYVKLEKEYLEKNVGIFDESEDMYSAISVADGYYGDSSSMLSLFGVTGKPVCIQNVSVASYDRLEDERLRFETACINNEKIYFANKDYNTLAEIDNKTGTVHYIDVFPESGLMQKRITSNIGLWKGKLWMMPFDEGKVYSYDILSGQWCIFELPEQWECGNRQQSYVAGKQIGRYYYGFGSRQYGVIKLDMETGEISYNADNLSRYEEIADKNNGIICRQDCCEAEGKLYTACVKSNAMLEYDLQNEKIEIAQVGSADNRYITIAYDGEAFWLTTKEGLIIRWNKKTGDVQEINIDIDGYQRDGENAFASSLYADQYVWFFALSANMNIRINVHTCEVEKVYEFTTPYEFTNPVRVLKNWYEDGKVCFVDAYNYSIVQIDEENKVNEFELLIGKSFRQEMGTLLGEVWKADNTDYYLDYIYRERHETYKNLAYYLDYVVTKKPLIDENQKRCFLRFTKYPEGNSGEIIHRKMTGKE